MEKIFASRVYCSAGQSFKNPAPFPPQLATAKTHRGDGSSPLEEGEVLRVALFLPRRQFLKDPRPAVDLNRLRAEPERLVGGVRLHQRREQIDLPAVVRRFL